jgi:hypothetical protein
VRPRRPEDILNVVEAKKNPFASHRVIALPYRADGVNLLRLLDRLASLDWHAAIVGKEGRGKTTLLENLFAAAKARGIRAELRYLAAEREPDVAEEVRAIADAVDPRSVLFLDSVERLGRRGMNRLVEDFSDRAGIVVTRHSRSSLPILHECRTELSTAEALVRELLGRPIDDLLPEIARLFRRHRGDIRKVLADLYDRFAAM